MPSYRYSRWDGSQENLFLHEDALVDQMSDELLAHGDATAALRNLLKRGLQTPDGKTRGLQDLLEQVRHRREETLAQYDLSSIMSEVMRRLESIRQHEAEGIERQALTAKALGSRGGMEPEGDHPQPSLGKEGGAENLDQDTMHRLLEDMKRRAAAGRKALSEVPWEHLGRAVEKLRGYEFTDAEAKRGFDELVEGLEEQAAETLFKGLSEGLTQMKPGEPQGVKEMLRDLNRMLQRRLEGGDPGFEDFKERYGGVFGDNPPRTLDGLLKQMRQRMSQTDSLLDNLNARQKQELQELVRAAFGDDELQRLAQQLMATLRAMDPMEARRREYPFNGQEEIGLSGALDMMNRLQHMDHAEQQLRQASQGGNMQGIDPRAIEEALGPEARRDVERLAQMEEVLEQVGYIHRRQNGQSGNHFELTPKGMRKIGQRALQEIFSLIKKDRAGSHTTGANGQGIEFVDATKPYQFGDPFLPNLQRTIMNAVIRGGDSPPRQRGHRTEDSTSRESEGPDSRPTPLVHLRAEDFEVYRTEHMAQSSTVLMLDLSLSMAMRGNFMATKKVALALDNLIRTSFPRDKLFIVGFSTYARQMKPEQLAYLQWDEFEPYTNIQHGLMLSQKLLGKIKGGTKQLIMISDGEPTAHMEGGQVFLQYPPSPQTIRQTLAEVKRCTQNGITINTFILDRNAYLVDFVEQMTRLNHGRVFYTTPERLGKYILVDYISAHRKRVVG